MHKINVVVDNDIIVLRPLSVVQKIHETNAINSVIDGRIMVKFCTRVANDKTKYNSECTNKIPKSALTS